MDYRHFGCPPPPPAPRVLVLPLPPPPLQTFPPVVVPSAPPRETDTTFCSSCDKSFISALQFQSHCQENHIFCEEEGCDFSAPPDLFAAHKLKHLKNESGETIIDSPEETEAWMLRRRFLFPRSGSRPAVDQIENLPVSTLEQVLRSTMTGPKLSGSKRTSRARSALMPEAEKHLRHFETRRRKLLDSNVNPKGRSADDFHVCQSFLRKKTCPREGNCPYSHNLQQYFSWLNTRHGSGLAAQQANMATRALYYRLIVDDVRDRESHLFAAMQVMVANNFWLDSAEFTVPDSSTDLESSTESDSSSAESPSSCYSDCSSSDSCSSSEEGELSENNE